DVARTLGAEETVTSAADLDGARFAIAVDATGVPAAIESILDLLDPGGRLLVFGVAPAQARVAVSPFRIYNDELTIVGSMAILRSFGQAVDPGPLLREPLPLEAFAEAVSQVRAGNGIKWHISPG